MTRCDDAKYTNWQAGLGCDVKVTGGQCCKAKGNAARPGLSGKGAHMTEPYKRTVQRLVMAQKLDHVILPPIVDWPAWPLVCCIAAVLNRLCCLPRILHTLCHFLCYSRLMRAQCSRKKCSTQESGLCLSCCALTTSKSFATWKKEDKNAAFSIFKEPSTRDQMCTQRCAVL